MDKQAIYNKVRDHLLAQGKKSRVMTLNGVGTCQYRGPNDTSCAVGCLITDEAFRCASEASYVFNSLTVEDERVIAALADSGVDVDIDKDLGLLKSLQSIHDHHYVEDWSKALTDLAERAGLSP